MPTQPEKARALAAAFGDASRGQLAPSGIPIEEIAERYGTPFYLYDAGLISARAQAVRRALGTELAYSIKANPSLAICQLIAAEDGVGAEEIGRASCRERVCWIV